MRARRQWTEDARIPGDAMTTTTMTAARMVARYLLLVVIPINPSLFSQEADTLAAEDILKMSLMDLMNTKVITASKVQQQIRDVPATVQVVTSQQIEQRGYFTLEEALSDLPGFQFRNILGFNSYVFMRGAPSQNNLILLLVDGVQINELNSGGFYAGGQFNMSDIERIEVVYGPASALYGSNAISGIVNVITKTPDRKADGHISLLGGNFRTGLCDVHVTQYDGGNDFGYYVSGMYKTSEKADLSGAAGDNNWTNDMENFERDLSLSAKVLWNGLTTGVLYQEKWASMTTYTKSVGDKYLDRGTLWAIGFLNSYLKYNHTTSNGWALQAMLYYRNATVRPNSIAEIIKATDTSSGFQVGYYRPNHLAGFECQVTCNASTRLMIVGGIGGDVERLSEGFSVSTSSSLDLLPPAPGKPDQLSNRLFSAFVQVHYKILDQISFIGGLRRDFSSYYGRVATPRMELVFNECHFTAKLLYAEAFRAPKPWDYNYGTGNSDLQPERMQSFELAMSYLLTDNLAVGSSVYRNRINDILSKEYSASVDRWINKESLLTMGCEVYGTYSTGGLSLYANYTFTDSYNQEDVSFPEVSAHTANAGITYACDGHMNIHLRTNYLGKRTNPTIIPNTGTDRIDDALLLHGSISYRDLEGFDIQLKVNNILNQEYYHPSNRFAGRYRQPQRTMTVKISCTF
jgi:outer membrane receptor for ferrienterochelin and colicins